MSDPMNEEIKALRQLLMEKDKQLSSQQDQIEKYEKQINRLVLQLDTQSIYLKKVKGLFESISWIQKNVPD